MRVSARSTTLALLCAAATLLAASPLQADPPKGQTQAPRPVTVSRKPPPGHPTLSNGDCTHLGGTVVVVTDDRCGSTRRYCRTNDGNAICIDTLDTPG